jgi:hypothetical protein
MANANQLLPQGTLNRLRASVTFVSLPGLNIPASYLGKEMIGMSFDGVITTPLETATGVVTSPEPYQRVTVSCHLVKSMALASLWQAQILVNSLVGDFVVRPDSDPSISLGPFSISNGMVNTVSPLRFDGTDPNYSLILSGQYYVNSNLFNT